MPEECGLCGSRIELETELCVVCHRAIRFVLLPARGAPIPLVPGAEVSFGRDEDCTIRISDRTVSRLHAELGWCGREPVLRDQSRHGTFVNGRPLEQQTLQGGDFVRMGGFLFSVLDRASKSAHASRPATEAIPLEGRVTPGRLCEVVQALSTSQHTGRLSVCDIDGRRSWLALRGGTLAAAQEGLKSTGEEAVLAILSTGSGRFSFSPSEAAWEGHPIKASLASLIAKATAQQEQAALAKTVVLDPRKSQSLRAG